MSCDVITGRSLVAFFEPQTGGLSTIANPWPTGGSVKAVRMNTVQVNPDSPSGEPPRWATGSRTEIGDLARQLGFSLSMEHYPYGASGANTERDWELLFTYGGWKVYAGPAATTITTGATTTNLPLTSVAGLEQFDCAIVEVNGTLELRLISDVNAGDVDVFPPFSDAPADGATVSFGRTLQLDDAWCPETQCLTAWFFNGSSALHRVTGLVMENVDWGGSADSECIVTHNGKAYRVERILGTTLASAISDGVVTSMDVAAANCVPDDINSARTVYYQIDDEIVGVTASDGSGTLTITRGQFSTTAAGHSSGATVSLYVPTASYSGVNPTGINSGGFRAWQSGTALPSFCVSSFQAEIAYGVTFSGCFGGDYAIGQAAASGKTKARLTANGWGRKGSTMVIGNYGESRTPLELQATIGDSLGRMMAAMTPNLYPDNPPLDLTAEIVTLDVTGAATGDETLGTTSPPGAGTSFFFLQG